MNAGKLIRCICHEPLGQSKTARQPWADVWIRFTAKPGRKVERYGPTLVSKPSLLSDLQCAEMAKDFQDMANLNSILDQLETTAIVVGQDWDYGTPSIYTAKDFIDRQVAEEMLSEMMLWLRYSPVRFKWERPKLIAYPA